MTLLPRPLIGRAPALTAPPRVVVVKAPSRAAWAPPYGAPTGTPYPPPGRPLPAGAPFWLAAEADRLRRLAEVGGDLPAHIAEHLESR